MDELYSLKYRDEVEALKDEADFEALGDERYLNHEDMEARLYWAFCRPSGSCATQLQDPDPTVSIMAFNHSRLPPFERFSLVHPEVLRSAALRVRISKRSRMLFRSLVDDDFSELNRVLDLVPEFCDLAIDQLKNGRRWNEELAADDIEATRFLQRANADEDAAFLTALFAKLNQIEPMQAGELKDFLNEKLSQKDHIDPRILEHYRSQARAWLDDSQIHILQKKSLEALVKKL